MVQAWVRFHRDIFGTSAPSAHVERPNSADSCFCFQCRGVSYGNDTLPANNRDPYRRRNARSPGGSTECPLCRERDHCGLPPSCVNAPGAGSYSFYPSSSFIHLIFYLSTPVAVDAWLLTLVSRRDKSMHGGKKPVSSPGWKKKRKHQMPVLRRTSD